MVLFRPIVYNHDVRNLGEYLFRGRIAVPSPAHINGSEDNLVLGDGFCVAVLAHPDGSKSVAGFEVEMPPAP